MAFAYSRSPLVTLLTNKVEVTSYLGGAGYSYDARWMIGIFRCFVKRKPRSLGSGCGRSSLLNFSFNTLTFYVI